MAMNNNREARALLKSVSEDGTEWLFVLYAEDKWAITRNGKPFAVGATDRAGIGSGVEQYLLLTGAGKRQLETARA
jgi:hypothetical protein